MSGSTTAARPGATPRFGPAGLARCTATPAPPSDPRATRMLRVQSRLAAVPVCRDISRCERSVRIGRSRAGLLRSAGGLLQRRVLTDLPAPRVVIALLIVVSQTGPSGDSNHRHQDYYRSPTAWFSHCMPIVDSSQKQPASITPERGDSSPTLPGRHPATAAAA
jgi:hypothetical protein